MTSAHAQRLSQADGVPSWLWGAELGFSRLLPSSANLEQKSCDMTRFPIG